MWALEDTMNFTLCGLLLMLLITLCFVAFSAAMVKYCEYRSSTLL